MTFFTVPGGFRPSFIKSFSSCSTWIKHIFFLQFYEKKKKRKILTYVIVFDEIHDFLDCSRRFNIKIHLMIIECLCYNSIHITPKRIVHNISTLSLSLSQQKKSKILNFSLWEKKKRFFISLREIENIFHIWTPEHWSSSEDCPFGPISDRDFAFWFSFLSWRVSDRFRICFQICFVQFT